MKHFILSVSLLLFGVGVACAVPARPISKERLPDAAQQFLQEYFSSEQITSVHEYGPVARRVYEVMLGNATHIEFAANGQWREVESGGALPAGIVPPSIESCAVKRYPSCVIRSVERGRHGWEVGLSNGVELTFDKGLRLIEVDD
jgi:hypothetical protein